MTATLINSNENPTELRVFKVGNDSTDRADADVIVPAEDLTNLDQNAIDITRRIQEWKDSATFGVKDTSVTAADNDQAVADYVGEITSGDRIEFWVSYIERDAQEAIGYGEGGYGEGGYGGGFSARTEHRWTGWAHEPALASKGGGRVTIVFDATDFVFETLSKRISSDAFEDELIAGSSDAIVNHLLAEHAPEIDPSGVEDVGVRTDREFDGRDLKEIFSDLSETADALMASSGTQLIYKPFDDIPVKHELGWNDVYGHVTVDPNDDDVVNDWRIDGGTGTAPDEFQETVDSYQVVSEDNPLTYQLDPDKNRLDRIDVWTRRTGSGENLNIRIQAPNSDGTGPRDPADDTKDIVSDRSDAQFLADDGWRERFRLQREPLPDDPWLIINSGGSDGQEIGVDANGAPSIRTYYPYPVNVRVDDAASIDKYRLRQGREKKSILSSFDAARDVAEAKLRRSREADATVSCTARTLRAHQLEPGEVVDLQFTELNATGEHIVVERGESYEADSNRLETSLTLQDLASV